MNRTTLLALLALIASGLLATTEVSASAQK